ncbi:MAG: hypothetical protein N3B21_14870 [Clostridia bacterium]|nr:hypothetical protein [Clostridia bacterium]
MSYLKERVAYLKGLAEGMQIGESTNEGRLLKAMIEVMDDFALAVEDIEEVQEQLSEQVDNIDEDLAEVEGVIFGEDDEDEDIMFKEIECPHCGEAIEIDADMVDEDGGTIECPSCHKDIEVVWECGCHECDGHDHE